MWRALNAGQKTVPNSVSNEELLRDVQERSPELSFYELLSGSGVMVGLKSVRGTEQSHAE